MRSIRELAKGRAKRADRGEQQVVGGGDIHSDFFSSPAKWLCFTIQNRLGERLIHSAIKSGPKEQQVGHFCASQRRRQLVGPLNLAEICVGQVAAGRHRLASGRAECDSWREGEIRRNRLDLAGPGRRRRTFCNVSPNHYDRRALGRRDASRKTMAAWAGHRFNSSSNNDDQTEGLAGGLLRCPPAGPRVYLGLEDGGPWG